ncbi:putative toxin-antitoxin system toxin component, PIN family [Pannus brasiliensis CCIBt3594]|uniref:Toxin-antitoxin system toxin component, PIN family n=1 Tax=Pannus brasiliensis CCIBt3594 TaxID=1427578 RepID=A0AAW9QXS6_9CHRO
MILTFLLRKNTPPYLLYQAWRDRQFELVTSPEQLQELRRVMAYPKLQRYFTPEEARIMLTGIAIYANCVTSIPSISYSPDLDDNVILATAIAGGADYIITGDKVDLLQLSQVENIPIITARQALDILEQKDRD